MHKIYITLLSGFIVLLLSCSKEKTAVALPDSSVSIQVASGKDSVQMPLQVLVDSPVVIGLKATLSGKASATEHWVKFAADSTKILDFRAKYGTAELLPLSCYYFYKPMTRIAAGATVSDSAQVNIVLPTKLEGYTTYVLPIVIQSVDGTVEGPAKNQVVYYVIKTGKPAVISKKGWTIASFSSVYSSFVATNVLDDDNTTTYWTSNLTQTMPQSIAINFNKELTFTGVNYYVPTLLKYPTLGGYPTSIQIETSMDGTTWVSRGIFTGNISGNMQTLNTGTATGKYLRFTVLASVKYSNTYECIFISGISLVP